MTLEDQQLTTLTYRINDEPIKIKGEQMFHYEVMDGEKIVVNGFVTDKESVVSDLESDDKKSQLDVLYPDGYEVSLEIETE